MINLLKRVGDHFPYCITVVDVEGKGRPCIYANRYFCENTGYNPEEAISRNLAYLQGKRTAKDTIKFMRDCFEKKDACIQDIINYKKDGSPFLNRLLMLPFKHEGTHYYIGFQNDITHIKGLDEDNDKLREVSSVEIRHMINNPLAVIMGRFSLKLEKASTPEQIQIIAFELDEFFKRIHDYIINIESVSQFKDFNPFP